MNIQLSLALELPDQSLLTDFWWGPHVELKKAIELTLQNQGERFIYLWGPPGSGKSHILQGCCKQVDNAIYLPLSILKEWGVDSIEGMEHYSYIAIDAIDAIAGDLVWEEALFHLYNRIRDNVNTRLLITGLHSPAASPIQLPDLRSRLAWGLVYHVHELSDELKIQVLQHHAQKKGFELPESVALFLLNRCSRSMHALNQLLECLDEASLAAQRKITLPFVKKFLEGNIKLS